MKFSGLKYFTLQMGVIAMLLVGATLFSSFLPLLISSPGMVNAAPKSDPVRMAYSVTEKKSSTSSSYRHGPTVRLKRQLPVAESTLPHSPVLREMNDSEQHDMSTSTPSSESLESQLQSPHIVRKKALVDFDTSVAVDDLLQTLEVVQ